MTATLPPYSEEAEDHVVAACLMSERALEAVDEVCEPGHFYQPAHQRILTTCLRLREQGQPITPITVAEELDERDAAKAADLLHAGYPTSNAAHHAAVVRDYHVRRQLITAGQEIARAGWEPDDDMPAMLDRAERLVYDLTIEQRTGELRHITETLASTFERLNRPGGEVTGAATGLNDLDRLTGGFQEGNLVILAARPGMGKSALLVTQALHISKTQPVALFTLEMSEEEINQRCLSQLSDVNLHKIRTRMLTEHDRRKLDAAGADYQQRHLYVDDTAAPKLSDIRGRCRRLKQRHPDLALICVDYLQLMLSEAKEQNRNLEIASLSRGLKVLARELDVPIVAAAQLNRGPEYRHDKRPMLSDLRDSGALEQDADLVLFLYRDGYYTKEDDTICELIVSKHRNGPIGTERAQWEKDTAQLRNLAPEVPW